MIVQHADIIGKVRKETYYRDFLNFIELRECNSSFYEKSKACVIFNSTQGVPEKGEIMAKT